MVYMVSGSRLVKYSMLRYSLYCCLRGIFKIYRFY